MCNKKWLMLCLSFLFYGNANAQATEQMSEQWQFILTPALWNASVEANLPGSGNGGGEPINPDYSFFSLENLTNYLSLQFEAKHGRFSLLFDSLQVRYEDELAPGLSNANVYVSSELGYIELATAYQLLKRHKLDLLGGVRQSFLDMNVSISINGDGQEFTFDGEDSSRWTDPIIGLRYNYPLTKNWQLWLRGDVAVFSVDTKQNINALVNAQYIFNKYVSLMVGYRYFQIDFKEGDILNDVALKGVYLGAGIHF